jgi:uncharacterized protein YegP (UPF0339 family)
MSDLTHPYFSLYKDVSGQWRWTVHAKNHKKLADSSESYHNKQDALHGIDLVKGATKVWDATTKSWIS